MPSARRLLFDTTYLLPIFGIDVEVDSSASIRDALDKLRSREVELLVSDLTPFEAFVKSYRIAEKLRDEDGMLVAKSGFTILVKSEWLEKIDHKNDTVVEEMFKIRREHSDPFDCFIFATAKAFSIPLVTEDRSAFKFLGEDSTMTWKKMKQAFKV